MTKQIYEHEHENLVENYEQEKLDIALQKAQNKVYCLCFVLSYMY